MAIKNLYLSGASPDKYHVDIVVVKPFGNQYRALLPTANRGMYNVVMNILDTGWSIVFYPWNSDTPYGKLENPEYFNNISRDMYSKNQNSEIVFRETIRDFLLKVDSETELWGSTFYNNPTPGIPVIKGTPLVRKYRFLNKHWATKRGYFPVKVYDPYREYRRCDVCKGTGVVMRIPNSNRGWDKIICPVCNGKRLKY